MTRFLPFLLSLFTLSVLVRPAWSQDPQSGWSFQYPQDNFSQDAVLDLRYLNEEMAGQNGFIRLSEDGESFVNDQGEIRFWAINGGELVRGHDPALSDQDLSTYARFLAKMGVNMIRYHGQMFPLSSNINASNRAEADNIRRVVAAMKKEGIYTTISPFWPAHLENIPSSWGLGDYVGDIDPWGLIYFDQHFRDAYKSWVTQLYQEVNPHTGIALKDDPSVGLIQIINEDGVFFWTIGNAQPSLQRLMQQQFYAWAETTYGNIQDALRAWNGTGRPEDDVRQSRLGIIPIWHASDDPNVPTPSTGFKNRLSDQMKFFAQTQEAVYRELYDHYRSIGCRQLINASNWKTASAGRLLDLERWTGTSAEVMAANRYYSPGHFGPNNGWRIERLHHYEGKSAMHHPHQLPINIKQVVGKPFLVTESGWNLPHKYQAEGPFLIAAYQSLTGIDGFYWFSPSSTTYEDDPYWPYFGKINGEEPMYRWTVSTPGQIGMFPANALMYRLGYIKTGTTILREERSFNSLVRLETPMITEEKSFDPNRDSYTPDQGSAETAFSPLTYLAGPVRVNFDGDTTDQFTDPGLDQLIDIPGKRLTSVTGELTWDYQQGICVLNTPKAQGICGFPEQKNYELDDVNIRTTNDYLTVNVVSMDNAPLQSAHQILVQVGTVYRPSGWRETTEKFAPGNGAEAIDGFLIESLGRMPWKAANTAVDMVFKDIRVTTAWLLDAAGYKKEMIPVTAANNGSSLTLPAAAMYVMIETEQLVNSLTSPPLLQTEVSVFPNPGTGNFTISIPEKHHHLEIERVEVLDPGKTRVASFKYQHNASYQTNLPSGVYFVRLMVKDSGSITKRIFIE